MLPLFSFPPPKKDPIMGRKGARGGGSKKVAGGSGGSNPKGTKYRTGARAASTAAARASSGKAGAGGLTAAALSIHTDRLEAKGGSVRRGHAGASAMSAASSDTPHSADAAHGTAALFAQVWRKANSQLEVNFLLWEEEENL